MKRVKSAGKERLKKRTRSAPKKTNARPSKKVKAASSALSKLSKKKLLKGKIDGTGKNYAFFVPDDGTGDLFIAGSCLHGAIDGDVVRVFVVSKKSGAGEGEVAEILERPNICFVGTVRGDEVQPDLRGLPPVVKIADSSADYFSGEKVYAKFTNTGAAAECYIIEKLGLEGNTDAEVLSVIRSYKIEERFSPEVQSEADKIRDKAPEEKNRGREDFTNDKVITIDGAHSKDFDDAICVKRMPGGGYRLYVHIADVSEYVVQDSAIDKTALRRGTSVYFADRVIPMLPEKLCDDLCSLVEGKDRLVLSCIIDYSAQGEVTARRMASGIIRSAARTTYDEIYAYMQGDENMRRRFAPISDMLDAACNLYKILQKKRLDNGSVEFDFIETEIDVDEKGEVTDVRAAVRNDAHKLIEEFMLAANSAVAAMFSEKKVPFVYRVHATPPPDKIQSLIELLKTLGIELSEDPKPAEIAAMLKNTPERYRSLVNMATLRSMSKAEYKTTNDGHYGLNFTDYCHFTSPIRRYPDLAAHRIIKQYMLDASVVKQKFSLWVQDVARLSSESERRAEEAERKVDDVLVAKFMRKKIGEVYPAKITGVTEWGIFAQIPSGVEGCIRVEKLDGGVYTYDEKTYSLTCGSRRYRLGDSVVIKVDEVAGDRINFSLCRDAEKQDS